MGWQVMCGIAGIFSPRGESAVLDGMLSRIIHRGPDDLSCYIDKPFLGGMTRLAINGLADGQQPLFDEQESTVVFYNGEIYNSKELRESLELKGYRFRTHSDGEVICHLYREHGEDVFEHLDGMFAISIWDKVTRKLVLARDIPGEKPLYYCKNEKNECYFASEIKCFKQIPNLELTLNQQAIWDFPTFLWIPQPQTIYNQIKAIKPGHKLVVTESSIVETPYANPFESYHFDTQDLVGLVRETVEEAVETRLLSEVPIGAFLSSGLDSSIVATLASKKKNISTFCISFEDIDDPYHGKANESVEATAYAKIIGSDHTNIPVNGEIFKNLIRDFCHYGDQPFGVSSGLGILAVTKAAHDAGIKVLLSGDGADEAFGGYSWYNYLSQKLEIDKDASFNFLADSFQSIGLTPQQRADKISRLPGCEQAWAWHYYAHEQEKLSLFNREWFGDIESSLNHFSRFKSDKVWEPLDFISHDRAFYFPNEMLTKLDRMSMAYSVEARAPFAAPKILQMTKQLAFTDMVNGTELKAVLRQAFRGLLPKEVYQRKKHGFNVPVDFWLKHAWKDLLHETFSDGSALMKLGIIDNDSIKHAYQLIHDPTKLHGHTLFCFIMLNQWLTHEKN